jgi:hypothetical protein
MRTRRRTPTVSGRRAGREPFAVIGFRWPVFPAPYDCASVFSKALPSEKQEEER